MAKRGRPRKEQNEYITKRQADGWYLSYKVLAKLAIIFFGGVAVPSYLIGTTRGYEWVGWVGVTSAFWLAAMDIMPLMRRL